MNEQLKEITLERDELKRKLYGKPNSKTRSGEIPKQLLSDEEGILVVDAYTGYNKVTQLESWQRAGCLDIHVVNL